MAMEVVPPEQACFLYSAVVGHKVIVMSYCDAGCYHTCCAGDRQWLRDGERDAEQNDHVEQGN